MMAFLPHTMKFLESLGVEFHLDWNEDLEIGTPDVVMGNEIASALEPFTDDITASLKRQSASRLYRFLGGPKDGQRHERYDLACRAKRHPSCSSHLGVKIRRAWWAVYQVQADGRAIFRGHATSEKKAKAGEMAAEPQRESIQAARAKR